MIWLLLACAGAARPPSAATVPAVAAGAVAEAVPAEPRAVFEGVELALPGRLVAQASTLTVGRSGEGAAEAVAAAVQTAPARGEEPPPPLNIAAARSDWDFAARRVRFEGEVVATRGEVTLRCDRLLVTFSTPEQVELATASGHVVVERGARSARGAQAVLDARTGQVVLTGAPELSEGRNRMSGERIVLWLDDERVECERCQLRVDGASFKRP